MQSITLNLTPPEGPVKIKYEHARDMWGFPELAFIGTVATGKTNALLDSAILSAFDYPGANLLLARAKLTDLRRSSIPKLEQKVRVALESTNLNEAIYRFPTQPDPITGNPTQSIIRCVGLERVDLEELMRSTEFFRVFLEEGNEMSSEAHDVSQERARQLCYHRELKVKHLVRYFAKRWDVPFDEAYQILLSSAEHPIGQFKLDLEHPMPGSNGVKTIFNPRNDHLWQRYVGIPYPKEGITREFVDKFVGIREVVRTYEDMQVADIEFAPGDLVVFPGGTRGYVRKVDEEGKVHLIHNEKTNPKATTKLILQRGCIYAFHGENESRNKQNTKNSLLMVNERRRKRVFRGDDDSKSGLVFPNFINEPFERGGHILPVPSRGIPKALNTLVGIDQGGAHATTAVGAFETGPMSPMPGVLIVYLEFLATGETSRESAYRIKQLPEPSHNVTWGGDPAMWHREFSNDRYDDGSIPTAADRFFEVGIPLMPGARGDLPLEDVNEALAFRDSFIGRPSYPLLLVLESMEMVLNVLSTATWQMMKFERNRWEVDIADALKQMVAMKGKGYVSTGTVVLPSPRPAFTNTYRD